jgi:DNA-binding transcriptional regulator LsrR (DeoR family)
MDEVQVTGIYDSIGAASSRAAASATHEMLLQSARHLRWDHGWGRRRVAKRLGVREKWVRDYVDLDPDR